MAARTIVRVSDPGDRETPKTTSATVYDTIAKARKGPPVVVPQPSPLEVPLFLPDPRARETPRSRLGILRGGSEGHDHPRKLADLAVFETNLVEAAKNDPLALLRARAFHTIVVGRLVYEVAAKAR